MAEQLAIDRAKQAVRLRLRQRAAAIPAPGQPGACSWRCCKPGDTILGMSLAAGGHLTHGAPLNQSGKWFNVVQYGVRTRGPADRLRRDRATGARAQAEADHRRRLGLSARHRLRALPRDRRRGRRLSSWSTWRISPAWSPAGVHPSPVPHADVVTTTTHKTLRGPRGGMILTNDEAIGQEDQLGDLPRPPGRPADACHRRQGGGLRRGAAARVQGLPAAGGRQCRRRWPTTLVEGRAATSSPAAPTPI